MPKTVSAGASRQGESASAGLTNVSGEKNGSESPCIAPAVSESAASESVIGFAGELAAEFILESAAEFAVAFDAGFAPAFVAGFAACGCAAGFAAGVVPAGCIVELAAEFVTAFAAGFASNGRAAEFAACSPSACSLSACSPSACCAAACVAGVPCGRTARLSWLRCVAGEGCTGACCAGACCVAGGVPGVCRAAGEAAPCTDMAPESCVRGSETGSVCIDMPVIPRICV